MPSSVIKHYHYDNEKHTLVITFVTDLVYRYFNVPEKVYKLFKASISKGKYFNHHIKEKYAFEKLD